MIYMTSHPQSSDGKTESAKFRGKYRIASARHPKWDYGSNASYFVTICTKNREPYFGIIDDMALPPVETQNFASLRGNDFASLRDFASLQNFDCTRMHTTPLGEIARKCWLSIPDHFPFVQLDAFVVMPDHIHGIITINKPDSECDKWKKNEFAPQSKNLASIIRGFKIGVTKFANEHDLDFAWQSRFHDRIIRKNDDIESIRFYIKSNPSNWINGKIHDDEDFSPTSK